MRRGVNGSTVIAGALVIVVFVATFIVLVAFRSTEPSYRSLSTSATGSILVPTLANSTTLQTFQKTVATNSTPTSSTTATSRLTNSTIQQTTQETVTTTATVTAPTPTVTVTAVSCPYSTNATGQNLPWMVPGNFVAYQVIMNGTLAGSGTLRITVMSVWNDTIGVKVDPNVHFNNGSVWSKSDFKCYYKLSGGNNAFFDTVSRGGSPELLTLNGNTYQTIKFSSQDSQTVFWVESTTRIVVKLVHSSQTQFASSTLQDTNFAIPTVSPSTTP